MDKRISTALVISGLCILLNTYFVPYITIIGAAIILILSWLLMMILTIFSMRIFLKAHKLMPIIGILVYFGVILYAKNNYCLEQLDFYLNLNTRKKVVEIVENRNFAEVEEIINLPDPYSNNLVSQSNRIIVYNIDGSKTIFFYYFKGFLEESSGFVFTESEDSLSTLEMIEEFDFGGGWYFCTTD